MQNSKLKFKVQNFKDIGFTKLFLFLTILLAPLYVVRFSIGAYPSTPLEILIGLTVVVWIIERKGLKGIKGINVPTALFLVAAAISIVASPDKQGGLGIFKAYFVEPLLIFLVIKDVVKSKKDWWLVFGALGLSGLWVALLAVLQGLTGWFVFAPHEALQGRAHGVYNTANAVGLYIGPVTLLLLGVFPIIKEKFKIQNSKFKITIKSSKLRLVMLFTNLAMVLAIVLSKSTGAMVGLAAGLGVLGILKKKWLNGQMVKLLGLAALVAGVWFFFNISSFTPENIDPYVRKSTDTLQFRLCLWEGARDLLLDKPIFGAGLSGFKELYSQKYFTCDAEPLEYPHNWILNFWTETGILGLLGFLGILGVYFRNIKYQISNIKCRWLARAFAAAIIYWLVHGLVDVPYFKNDLALEFWVVVGLAETLGLFL